MEDFFPRPARAESDAPAQTSVFTNERLLGACIVAMIGLGAYLRVHAFDFPEKFLFDEHHFVENARNYLQHRADSNDHPPLGKLVIATSILAFGDHAFAWRLPALASGVLTIVLGGWAAARLFRTPLAGWLAAALLSADGFLIGYSRAALLDGFLALSVVVTLLVCTFRWTPWLALAAGLVAGLATSMKFTGGAVGIPLLLSLTLTPVPRRQKLGLGLLLLGAAVTVYFAQYSTGLWLTHRPASLGEVVTCTRRLLEGHAKATAMTHPLTSSWPTWILPRRPLLLGYEVSGRNARALSAVANLATWWAALGVALTLAGRTLWQGLSSVVLERPGSNPPSFLTRQGRAAVLCLLTALAFLLPWVLTRRDSYIYHSLPSYHALIVLLAGYLAWQWRERPRLVLGFITLALGVALFYAPVWSFFRLKIAYVEYRLPFESWR